MQTSRQPHQQQDQEETAWQSTHRLTSVSVIGGFLDGVRFDLADGLDCLVGARGTGKTTALELVRYAIDALPGREANAAEHQRIESAVQQRLAGGRVEVRLQTRDGLEYTIARFWGEEPVVLTANGSPTATSLVGSGIFEADVLQSGGRNRPREKPHSELVRTPDPPLPFERGQLTFYPTRVELCGVKVCADEASGVICRILEALRSTDAQGRRRPLSGEELSAMIGSDGGATAVAGAIRNFRNRVKRTMLTEANVAVHPSTDLIVNDRQHGYRFSDKVTAVERPGLLATNRNEDRDQYAAAPTVDHPSGTNAPPGKPDDDARSRWILAELKKTGRIRKRQIVQRSGCSDSTARRALARLRDKGRIVFEGSVRSGYWRLA
jgi:hypothetical protein